MTAQSDQTFYLECEKRHVFFTLMFIGGFYGAYTYTVRGGVFCNAQTANFVLMSIALGNAQFLSAAYYLIPMSAYFLGSVISEAVPNRIRKTQFMRWDTFLIALEILTVILLGFIPESWPFQITQIAVNFICAMQYNTFRMARGIPMATVFCTNHVRQLGINFVRCLRHGFSGKDRSRLIIHGTMLICFTAGAVLAAVLGRIFQGRTIWFAAIPLLIVFSDLLHADLKAEKEEFSIIPHGH